MKSLHTTDFPGLNLWRRGKVRDIYDLGDSLLFIATDRISAYDVIMDQTIPGKGALLTTLSLFWFDFFQEVVPHHLITADVNEYPEECLRFRDHLEGRSMLVQKTTPLPIECVARGYLAGSGWREYTSSGTICGIQLPRGLERSAQLSEPIFTPATKAEEGHDENISFEQASEIVGKDVMEKLRELTLTLYSEGAKAALERGIIIADTKFEFGLDEENNIILIDEVLTPDSSRFWLASEYQLGREPVNFDKQYLRDYLETLDWNKMPPPPHLPEHVVRGTYDRYRKAVDLFTPKN